MKRTTKKTSNPKNRAKTLANLLATHRELDAAVQDAELAYQQTPTQARQDEIRKQKRRKCTLKTRIERFKKLCGETVVEELVLEPGVPEVPAVDDAPLSLVPSAGDEPKLIFRSRRVA